MLTFIIPLKSQQVAHSWSHTCKLLERTLKSICRQTNPDFEIILVYQDRPELTISDSRIHYQEVSFNIPATHLEKERDKGKKIITGLRYCRQLNPTHVMIVDADDCLNSQLVEFVNSHPDRNGWVISQGYVYQESSPFLYYRKSHFYSWCGTCNIMKFELCPLAEDEETYPEDLVDYYSGKNHRRMAEQLQERGFPLEELPFIGAVYIVGHGENIYQTGFSKIHNANRGKLLFQLKELTKFRLLTPAIANTFGLYGIHP